jgi:hypothetical protein
MFTLSNDHDMTLTVIYAMLGELGRFTFRYQSQFSGQRFREVKLCVMGPPKAMVGASDISVGVYARKYLKKNK